MAITTLGIQRETIQWDRLRRRSGCSGAVALAVWPGAAERRSGSGSSRIADSTTWAFAWPEVCQASNSGHVQPSWLESRILGLTGHAQLPRRSCAETRRYCGTLPLAD